MAMKNKRRKHMVKQQIGVVITDLEKVISELNTVVRELKGVLNQIERVSSYLDDEPAKQNLVRKATTNENEIKTSRRIAKKEAFGPKNGENGVTVPPRMCSPCKSLSQFVTVRNGMNGTAKCAFTSSSPQKCRGECTPKTTPPIGIKNPRTDLAPRGPREADGCVSGDEGSPRARRGCYSTDSWCSSPRHDIVASWGRRSSYPSPASSLAAKLREKSTSDSQHTSCSDDTQSVDFQANYNRDINTWTTYAMVHIDASSGASDAWSADEATQGSDHVLSPTHSCHSGDRRIMYVSPLVVESV